MKKDVLKIHLCYSMGYSVYYFFQGIVHHCTTISSYNICHDAGNQCRVSLGRVSLGPVDTKFSVSSYEERS